ncbi:MAG TPA: ABC transporter permease [Micromonosporaceae bacterium]|nr:ABC transporter permease [Micromonosporaceae bacterium]
MTQYAGTTALARLIVRRDRIRLGVWVYVIAGLIASTAYSFRGLYQTVAEREAFGASIRANPTLLALDGPIFNASTTGGLTAWRFGGFAAVAAAMASIFTVVRHTRAEEESGRTELVGAGVVGRRAPLTAALTVAIYLNVLAGALTILVMVLLGAGGAGAVALGAGITTCGIAFAGIAAVAAQLTEGSRAANGIGFTVLGVAFVLRAVGDAAHGGTLSFLSWLSPIGWAQQVRPYAGERWWVLALGVGLGLALSGVAYALVARRDIGAGLVPPRLGPASAASGLRNPIALAWRQHRGSLVGWSIGMFLLGVAYGGSAKGVGTLIDTSAQLRDIINRLGGSRGLTNAYFTATLGIGALIAAAYAVQATLRARSEETALRAEVVLATPVRRVAYAGSHLLLAAVGAAILLAATGVGSGLAYGVAVHDVGGQLAALVGAALAQWPAAMVPAGIAALLFGVAPRLTTAAWALLAAFVILGQVGPILRVTQPVMDLSPFTHTPKLPGVGVTYVPFVLLTAVAVGLALVGLAGFRRRDVG